MADTPTADLAVAHPDGTIVFASEQAIVQHIKAFPEEYIKHIPQHIVSQHTCPPGDPLQRAQHLTDSALADTTPVQARGPAFEQAVDAILAHALPADSWHVTHVAKRSRTMDFVATHKKTSCTVGIECKCTKYVPQKEMDKFHRDKLEQGFSGAVFISRTRAPGHTPGVDYDPQSNELFLSETSNAHEISAAVAAFVAITMPNGTPACSGETVARAQHAVEVIELQAAQWDAAAKAAMDAKRAIDSFASSHAGFMRPKTPAVTPKFSVSASKHRPSTSSAKKPRTSPSPPTK